MVLWLRKLEKIDLARIKSASVFTHTVGNSVRKPVGGCVSVHRVFHRVAHQDTIRLSTSFSHQQTGKPAYLLTFQFALSLQEDQGFSSMQEPRHLAIALRFY